MSDDDHKGPPRPDDISKQLSEFIKKHFNGAVALNPFSGMNTAEEEGDPPGGDLRSKDGDIFDFHYRPRDIKGHLDRFVIRQDEAKKALSIAVCDHYNHAKFLRRLGSESPSRAKEIEIQKQNVIVVGPTGVGKTYLVKHIADLIGVPFVKADATKFSETGYVGGDVDDLVRELVRKADGDVELAEYGIIYIDEIDKLATSGNMIGRDVSGRGVQTTLLKLMEDTEVTLRNPMDIQSQMQAMFDSQRGRKSSKETINTRHILFIVSGAFSGLEKIVSRRLREGAIGFGAETKDIPMDNGLFAHVSTQDFIDFGFEAEFIGRLPVRVVCEPLTAGDLFEIMTSSEGSLIRQYEREFEAYGIKADFKESGLRLISERAAVEKTGARALMTVCERILRDFKFVLPGTAVTEIVIDEELIQAPGKALDDYVAKGGGIEIGRTAEELQIFATDFKSRHGVSIGFEADAVVAITERSSEKNMSVLTLCRQLFKDYQFGLKLVEGNTGQEHFPLPRQAIDSPERYLSDLVVRSYASDGQGSEGSPEGKSSGAPSGEA